MIVYRTVGWALLLLLLIGLSAAHAASWRGWPPPRTETFLITEVGLMARVNNPSPWDSRWLIAADIGAMRNLNRHWAMGGTVSGVADDIGWRIGPSPRARFWLNPDDRALPVSLDLSAAIYLLGNTNHDEYRSPAAFAVGASLNYGDLFVLTTRVEAVRLRHAGTDLGVFAGAKVGSYLTPVVGVLSAAALAIAAASFAGSGYR